MIQNPARSSDDDVGALLQTFELGGVADASVDRQAAHAPVFADDADLGGTLVGQLPGGGQYQGLGSGQLRVGLGDDGDAEGAGLAAAGPGLDHHVHPPPHQRDDPFLHRHRFGPAEIGDACADVVGKIVEE